MRLVLIYGPPAAGKTTISIELQKLMGYRYLENNVTNAPVQKVFPFGSQSFDRIVKNFRIDIFGEAASHNIDLITTMVYVRNSSNDEFVFRIIEAVEEKGGEVIPVRVTCPKDILFQRLENNSRKERDKLTDPDILKKMLDDFDMESGIPDRKSFVIDSYRFSPVECAGQIREILHSSDNPE